MRGLYGDIPRPGLRRYPGTYPASCSSSLGSGGELAVEEAPPALAGATAGAPGEAVAGDAAVPVPEVPCEPVVDPPGCPGAGVALGGVEAAGGTADVDGGADEVDAGGGGEAGRGGVEGVGGALCAAEGTGGPVGAEGTLTPVGPIWAMARVATSRQAIAASHARTTALRRPARARDERSSPRPAARHRTRCRSHHDLRELGGHSGSTLRAVRGIEAR
ncbi:MAG TPA: hypothetical protein VEK07_00730 [Polyangiaceae bacterium]|nr:hypothetical protein [Polyangiaceae bacterium]